MPQKKKKGRKKMSKKERSFRQRIGIYRALYKKMNPEKLAKDVKYREKANRYMMHVKSLSKHLDKYLSDKEKKQRVPPVTGKLMEDVFSYEVATKWEYNRITDFIYFHPKFDISTVNGISVHRKIDISQFIRELATYGYGENEMYLVYADIDRYGNANLYLV